MPSALTTRLRLSGPLDLARTVGPIRLGRNDPRIRVLGDVLWRATRTELGPATIRVRVAQDVVAHAWGPGAPCALDGLPALLGELDDAAGFEPHHHPVVKALARAHPGLRLPRTGAVFEAAVPAIISQKVTGLEAKRAFSALVRRHSDRAPGPADGPELWLPPTPAVVAALAGHRWPTLGLDGDRAATLRRAAAVADRLNGLATLAAHRASADLRSIPGIGPWTAAEVTLASHGDADAVSVGDYHLKNRVSFALAGEPRGTDERMLELLEPFRPHRARVVRLLETAGRPAPRYGPRATLPTHLPAPWSAGHPMRRATMKAQ
ncbi:MAG TPA: hypothetical protein VNB24_03960 [Acidimicrobiales bacterium]|nr:hypothetical protein [Acidimicrobiales bacterium]